jgi:hypothetical protein
MIIFNLTFAFFFLPTNQIHLSRGSWPYLTSSVDSFQSLTYRLLFFLLSEQDAAFKASNKSSSIGDLPSFFVTCFNNRGKLHEQARSWLTTVDG